MAEPILEGRADVVCGKVRLASSLDRPWLTPYLRVYLAELLNVSGDQPGMVGANMATSTEVARSITFDEHLGPGARGFADDTMFNLRLKAAGYRLVGSTGPPIEHHLSADRLEYRNMRRLAEANGSSHAYILHHWLHDDLRWLQARRFRASAQSTWLRLRTPFRTEGISEQEFRLRFAHRFATDLAKERSVPRNYTEGASGR